MVLIMEDRVQIHIIITHMDMVQAVDHQQEVDMEMEDVKIEEHHQI